MNNNETMRILERPPSYDEHLDKLNISRNRHRTKIIVSFILICLGVVGIIGTILFVYS